MSTEPPHSATALSDGQYVRRQWTGKPARFSDGAEDHEFAQCPSCLSHHAASYIGCNGKREPCDRQCEAVLGEIQCHRPANHIGAHQALSDALRVEWSIPHGPDTPPVTGPARTVEVSDRTGRTDPDVP